MGVGSASTISGSLEGEGAVGLAHIGLFPSFSKIVFKVLVHLLVYVSVYLWQPLTTFQIDHLSSIFEV